MRILIVEDHPLVQDVLHSVASEIFAAPHIDAAASCGEAVEKVRSAEGYDLVLLDLGLPDCAGLETLKRFRRARSEARIVVFSDADDPSSVYDAIQGGASGFLSKTFTRPVICAALQLVAAGGVYLPPQVLEAPRKSLSARHADLTDRQTDVLRLIVKGLRNKQIALRLRIAEDTVKQHARAAYGVLGVSSRTQAMTAVARRGIRLD
jgi:DNA-binding NarL/FixJ family response regulator